MFPDAIRAMVTTMQRNRTAIERAFDLAKSGACTSIADIKHCLRLEGYHINHIIGPSLARQLRELIAESRRQPMPKRPQGQKRSSGVISNAATGQDDDTAAKRRGGTVRAK